MAAPRRGEPPLYQRVRGILLDRLATGQYVPGDRLPSEGVLAEDLGVHRLTVRRALDELSREGLLRARQGAGTFVSPRPEPIAITIPLTPEEFSGSLRTLLRSHGQQYRDVLLASAPDDDAAVLGIRPGAPVLVREGLTADEDGRPVLRVRRRARADRVRYRLDYSTAEVPEPIDLPGGGRHRDAGRPGTA